MGQQSHIGWTEATWDPWYGCTKISPGCKFCYMYREMERYGRDPFTVQRSKTTFTAPLKWKESRLVFTCSWSDFFIESADAWRPEAWEVIKRTPHLTYQILTKRPELIAERLPKDWGNGYPNVWLGTSIESPEYSWRIERLMTIAARVRFLSLEPLLADPNLWSSYHEMPYLSMTEWDANGRFAGPMIGWVIVGGESGTQRRECDPQWIVNVVDQCRAARVPVFVKQDSGPKPGQQGRIPDAYWVHEFPSPPPHSPQISSM